MSNVIPFPLSGVPRATTAERNILRAFGLAPSRERLARTRKALATQAGRPRRAALADLIRHLADEAGW